MRFEKKLIYGVGINDWDTPVRKDGKLIKEYYLWRGVLERCYSDWFQNRTPAYRGTTCSEEWLALSKFANDIRQKPNFDKSITDGWQLDKDILVKGSKHYSNETTCFVPPSINNVILKSDRARGDLCIGVTAVNGKFQAQLRTENRKSITACFDTEVKAFLFYKKEKEKQIKRLAELFKDQLDSRVYQASVNYQVEITD
ncbi:hypothetical protein OHW04_02150 [Acinetobacter baumannii]|nr:hypothetical protein [Acinetobacter baumannii]